MAGLGILLVERSLARQREIYLGNLQWSMLGALCRIGGVETKLPSYGDICERQSELTKQIQTKEELQAEIGAKLDGMLSKYMKKGA